MRIVKWIALAGALALAATGIAVAAHKGSPKTEAATLTFTAERTAVKEKTCTSGTDSFREAHEVFEGTSTSSDSRLAGKLTLRTHSFVNQTSGLGSTRGKLWVRDAATGELKAKASLVAVNAKGGVLNGVLAGVVPGSGKLVANVEATFTSATSLAGELGTGSSDNQAVIQSGSCPKGKGKG